MKKLLDKFTDKEIIKKIIELYPDQKDNIDGYVIALDELRNIVPVPTTISIEVNLNKEEDAEEWEKGGGDWYDVCGKEENDDTRYSISFTPWEQWLSMPITKNTMDLIPEIDIVAHCIWEMTWHGYSSESVKERANELMDRAREIDEEIKDSN